MNISELKSIIDEYLKSYFNEKTGYNKKIYDAMSYSLNIGGKRIRPLLLLLTYNMYNKSTDDSIPFAAALEMIHTYSLIHDDLPSMDNDDLRRGKPTNHKVFGEALAVLAGDGLLNEAANLMLSKSLKKDPKFACAAYEILYSAGPDGMIGGQVVDILNEGLEIELSELQYMHLKKTGELIKAAIVSGAILGEANEKEIAILKDYGYKLGLAFQIKDDILDVVSSTEVLGKTVNSDDKNNKTNYITVYGLNKCIEKCEEITNECIELLDSLDKDSSNLKNLTMLLLNRTK